MILKGNEVQENPYYDEKGNDLCQDNAKYNILLNF